MVYRKSIGITLLIAFLLMPATLFAGGQEEQEKQEETIEEEAAAEQESINTGPLATPAKEVEAWAVRRASGLISTPHSTSWGFFGIRT